MFKNKFTSGYFCCRDAINRVSTTGFTLVELIVVITILAILGTIGFISFSGYSSSARDSVRISDLTNIQKGLDLYQVKAGKYPSPDNPVNITANNTPIGYQGYLGSTVQGLIKLSGDSKDPLDNITYTYLVNSNKTKYQLLNFLENQSNLTYNSHYSEINSNNVILANAGIHTIRINGFPFSREGHLFVDQTYADLSDYSSRYINTKGDQLGILLSSGTLIPIQATPTGVDIVTTTGSYTAYFSNKDFLLPGTGSTLQSLQISYINGAGLGSPSSCPTGFIGVPGNQEFNQPGFCVAKYEMKQLIGDAGSWNGASGVEGPASTSNNPYCTGSIPCNNTSGVATINTKGTITSKPDGYPIVWINQYNAIEACKSMGAGYHLITENEWMTIARNIEANTLNWSGGIVGTTLNRGQTNGAYGNSSTGAMTANMGEYGSPNNGFINKRTHTLSNGQIIWDIAGNVWEHVNKANTMDTTNIDSNSFSVESACSNGSWNWWSWYGNDGVAECLFQNGYSRVLYGPKGIYNANQGMGRIYATNVEDRNNIFIRGAIWSDSSIAGVFALYLNWGAGSAGSNVGFRCAK